VNTPDPIPFGPEEQRQLERHWSVLVAGAHGRMSVPVPSSGVRSVVRASWQRSAGAQVRPDMGQAPLVLSQDQLQDATERTGWLEVAGQAVAVHQHSFSGIGHILSLFDHEARMLSCQGDPAALEGLAEINFRPGGHWAEGVVGTNGPGTALSTGAPAHIVGAEHFCERWQRWHCAAVPVRDPATGRIAGIVDISGFREYAHPHTLNLALALAVAIEQTLAAREIERRYLTLRRFTELTTRYPADAVLAVDRGGRLVGSSPLVPSGLGLTAAALVESSGDGRSREVTVPVGDSPRRGIWFPVLDGGTAVGGCLVIEGGASLPGSEGIPFRPGDVRVLARRFFEATARDLGRLAVSVDPEVYDALQAYHWPGDIRELKTLIRRVLLVSGPRVRLADLPQGIREAYPGPVSATASAIDREDAELMDVVHRSKTMAEAAARLGITRSTLYRRMERFGLKPRRVLGRE
jgi:transcriptional regulator of acetoin/glycerol metabolism